MTKYGELRHGGRSADSTLHDSCTRISMGNVSLRVDHHYTSEAQQEPQLLADPKSQTAKGALRKGPFGLEKWADCKQLFSRFSTPTRGRG